MEVQMCNEIRKLYNIIQGDDDVVKNGVSLSFSLLELDEGEIIIFVHAVNVNEIGVSPSKGPNSSSSSSTHCRLRIRPP